MQPLATWDDCIGSAKWLGEPLQRVLSYPKPLPVQQAVIPTIMRALMSGVPNDVSLTAPTGSGKTLCYLIPLVSLLTESKKGVDDNALRGLILVPTQALGQQVHRELQRLTRPSSIKVACICADVTDAGKGTSADVEAAEARELVRRVVLPRVGGSDQLSADGYNSAVESEEDASMADSDEGYNDDRRCWATCQQHRMKGTTVRYFSNVDVIVSTPQRLLHHLDHTRGLRLASLRLLVIDEADQVLAGNFASQVQKVNARYEFEVQQQQRRHLRQQERMCELLTRGMSSNGTSTSKSSMPAAVASSTLFQRFSSFGGATGSAFLTSDGPILHKVICSATLSSRIARISNVKLRNCSYYVLDSNGEERKEEGTASSQQAGTGSGAAADNDAVVRTQFALPPTLQEHIIFVEDTYRPAVLLKLVHALRSRIVATAARKRAAASARQLAAEMTVDSGDDSPHRETDLLRIVASQDARAASASSSYPNVEDRAGTGILIFCATAEEARVMSHFLAAAGVPSVVEFTTLSSEAERRLALLERTTNADDMDAGAKVSCVVASDALMRGIDIPNVGHVIMYHPPEAVSQYVHRAGRTARAMRPGHVHLLLSKTGPSGKQEDGEMALYKRLSQSLLRTLPVSYERSFFRFSEAPSGVGGGTATRRSSTATNALANAGPSVSAEPSTTTAHATATVEAGSAEWWVAQAGQFLVQSQHQLQRRWASVLESAAAAAAAKAKATAAAGEGHPKAAVTMAPSRGADASQMGALPGKKRNRSTASSTVSATPTVAAAVGSGSTTRQHS
ncbi:ATP-dependent RNA helicase, putative [Leishmania tarentolae]|uniref:ATP-dependent RNA helicase n=1 Tax=Leishmania tarentolae TaxID=5689 RepID=A0A640KEL5_LEITA|nr:ATP-dependent RNA helicase, putative [Leishmania tarentolae]